MRLLWICSAVLISSSSAWASNSFGASPFQSAPANADGNVEFPIQAFEPWVKTAKIGDFVAIKYKSGTTMRRELKSIDADVVVVEEKSTSNGKDYTFQKKYSRKEAGATEPRELDMKKTSTAPVKINGKDVNCEVWDGYIKGMVVSTSSSTTQKAETFKALRYQKTMAADVPFGGIVKEMQAPDDGIGLSFGKGNKGGRVNNKNENLELVFEATDFGNTQPKK